MVGTWRVRVLGSGSRGELWKDRLGGLLGTIHQELGPEFFLGF